MGYIEKKKLSGYRLVHNDKNKAFGGYAKTETSPLNH